MVIMGATFVNSWHILQKLEGKDGVNVRAHFFYLPIKEFTGLGCMVLFSNEQH